LSVAVTAGEGITMIVAVDDMELSVTDVAVSETVAGFGMLEGAV
jgi:hypothetical protein